MSERLYMRMRFHSNAAVVMRLSDGVVVRTRSVQRQEHEVTIEMLNKLVGVPLNPTGVVRARADGGHHDGEHVIPGQISSEHGLPATREQIPQKKKSTSQVTVSGNMVPQQAVRSVGQLLEEIPSIRLCRAHMLAGNAWKDWSEMTHRHVIARAVLRKERLAPWPNTLKESLVRVMMELTPQHHGVESATAQDVQDKTSGSSSSMAPRKSDEVRC